MSYVIAVLTWFHILGAIGWLGAAMFFGMIIGPLLPGLSPATRGELLVKLVPRFTRYVAGFAIATSVFGVALVFAIAGGNLSILSPSNSFGLFVSAGAAVTIVAMILAFVVVLPTANKIVGITKNMQQNPGPPPPELPSFQKRLRISATTVVVLLLIVLAFMVAAANI